MVQFLDENGKNAALKMNKTMLHGMRISVLPSKFPAIVDDTTKREDSMEISSNGSLEGNVDNEGKLLPSTAPVSSTIILKPRGLGLKSKVPNKPQKKLHIEHGEPRTERINDDTKGVNEASLSLSNEDFRKFFN